MDVLLSQTEPDYLEHLIAYQKVLSQRNSLLKNTERQKDMNTLLEVFDRQLLLHGPTIFEYRRRFLEGFLQKVQHYYACVSGEKEKTAITYESALNRDTLQNLLLQSRQKDILLQRTTRGIHRDDLNFLMNDHPLKQVGSQGQKKSFLFALKLAQFEWLHEHKGFSPILLLDDIFEKLDQQRIKHLIDLINETGFGQVLITDTETERLKAVFGKKEAPLQLITL